MMKQQTVLPVLASHTMDVRQTSIRVGNLQLPLELTMPAPTTGWMILSQTSLDDTQALDQVRATFHRMGVATLTVYLGTPGAGTKSMTERLLAATRWLVDQPECKGLPVSYFGMGEQIGVALYAAATQNQLSAIVSWNGRSFPAARTLRRIATPSLLLVNEHASWQQRWANRTAQWQLGSSSRFQLLPQADFETFTFDWYKENAQRQTNRAPQTTSLKRLLATGALAMALALPIVAPAIAHAAPLPADASAQIDADFDFSDGFAFTAADVHGDGFAAITSGTGSAGRRQDKESAKNKDGSTSYGAGAVRGDGFSPRSGEISWIDAGGLEFFVNTNITFTTSSSASAAASEATFTQAVAATTTGGGTTMSTLNDAFDGYNGLFVNGTSYNNNGTVTLECIGATSQIERQAVYTAQTIGNLSVSRKVFVPDDDEFIRWLNFVTNNGAATESVTLSTSNNLGSDSSTVIVTSSSGDTTVTTADNWVTTMQDYSGSTSSDPRLGHVLQGTGAPTPLGAVTFADGDDGPTWSYTFDVAPGETVAIMNFATGQPSQADAAAQATALEDLQGAALDCMTQTEIDQVINFDTFVPTDVSLTEFGGQSSRSAAMAALAILALPGIGWLIRRRRQTA
jgi:hypothetical protein